MQIDEQRLGAIERAWAVPAWIPQAEIVSKAIEDVAYLLLVIKEQHLEIAELKNNVRF